MVALLLRRAVSGLLLLAAVLLTSACSDMPTAPVPATKEPGGPTFDMTVQGCVIDGLCVLPPISGGGGGECDPWLDLNWCRDDGGQCMTSQPGTSEVEFVGLAGCPLPGPGPGGGSPPPYPSDPTTQPDTCNTQHPVIDDPAVQAGFQNLWNLSGYPNAQTQRMEHAAWIVRNPDGSYRIEPFSYKVQTPCSVNGNMNAPSGAVGWVHTHPFTSGEEMRVCPPVQREVSPGNWVVVRGPDGLPLNQRYANQPSQPDRDFMQAVNGVRTMLGQNKLDGYMIDNDKIVMYGTNGQKDWPFGRCGY